MKTAIRLQYKRVGPAHDPYSRYVYTAQVGARHLQLTVCALTGTTLEINGAIRAYHGFFKDDSRNTPINPIEEFERITKRTLEDVQDEEAERFDPDIAAAERAAGWDATP